MKIENIHSKTQYFTHIIPFNKRFINYRVNNRKVIFKYKGYTYEIDCNPLLVEDNIKEYIRKEEL